MIISCKLLCLCGGLFDLKLFFGFLAWLKCLYINFCHCRYLMISLKKILAEDLDNLFWIRFSYEYLLRPFDFFTDKNSRFIKLFTKGGFKFFLIIFYILFYRKNTNLPLLSFNVFFYFFCLFVDFHLRSRHLLFLIPIFLLSLSHFLFYHNFCLIKIYYLPLLIVFPPLFILWLNKLP